MNKRNMQFQERFSVIQIKKKKEFLIIREAQ